MTLFYWQHIDPWWAAAGTLLMLAGIALIYRSWRWQRRSGLVPGWALLMLSLLGWTQAGTAWIGLPIGACVLMLMVMGWIAWHGQWPERVPSQTASHGAAAARATPGRSASTWRPIGIRLLAAIPLAAVFAVTTSVLLAQAFPVGANRVFTERMAVTLLWTLGAAWACTATRPRDPCIIMAGASIAALLLLLLLR